MLVRLEDLTHVESVDSGDGLLNPAAIENMNRNINEFVRALAAAQSTSRLPYLLMVCPASTADLATPAIAAELAALEHFIAGELEPKGVHCVSSEMLFDLYPVVDYDDPRGTSL